MGANTFSNDEMSVIPYVAFSLCILWMIMIYIHLLYTLKTQNNTDWKGTFCGSFRWQNPILSCLRILWNATLIGVFVEWYIIMRRQIDYEHNTLNGYTIAFTNGQQYAEIDMFLMFWCSISAFALYKIISSIYFAIKSSSNRKMRLFFDQLFDIAIFQEIYREEPRVISDLNEVSNCNVCEDIPHLIQCSVIFELFVQCLCQILFLFATTEPFQRWDIKQQSLSLQPNASGVASSLVLISTFCAISFVVLFVFRRPIFQRSFTEMIKKASINDILWMENIYSADNGHKPRALPLYFWLSLSEEKENTICYDAFINPTNDMYHLDVHSLFEQIKDQTKYKSVQTIDVLQGETIISDEVQTTNQLQEDEDDDEKYDVNHETFRMHVTTNKHKSEIDIIMAMQPPAKLFRVEMNSNSIYNTETETFALRKSIVIESEFSVKNLRLVHILQKEQSKFSQEIENAIEDGADIYTTDVAPLIICAANGNVINLNKLLQYKDCVNIHTKLIYDDSTCLHHAVANNQYKMVKFLIQEAQCEVNAEDMFGRTPLIDACLVGNIDIINILIENGANANDHDENGHCALSYCEYQMNHHTNAGLFRNIAARLMHYGAIAQDTTLPSDISRRTTQDLTSLHVSDGTNCDLSFALSQALESQETFKSNILYIAAVFAILDVLMNALFIYDNGFVDPSTNVSSYLVVICITITTLLQIIQKYNIDDMNPYACNKYVEFWLQLIPGISNVIFLMRYRNKKDWMKSKHLLKKMILTQALITSAIGGTIKMYRLITTSLNSNHIILATSIISSICCYVVHIYLYFVITHKEHKRYKAKSCNYYTLLLIVVVSDFLLRSVTICYVLDIILNDRLDSNLAFVLVLIVSVFVSQYSQQQAKYYSHDLIHVFIPWKNTSVYNHPNIIHSMTEKADTLIKYLCGIISGWKFIASCDPTFVKHELIDAHLYNLKITSSEEMKAMARFLSITNAYITDDMLREIVVLSLCETGIRYVSCVVSLVLFCVIYSDAISPSKYLIRFDSFMFWIISLILWHIVYMISFILWHKMQTEWRYLFKHKKCKNKFIAAIGKQMYDMQDFDVGKIEKADIDDVQINKSQKEHTYNNSMVGLKFIMDTIKMDTIRGNDGKIPTEFAYSDSEDTQTVVLMIICAFVSFVSTVSDFWVVVDYYFQSIEHDDDDLQFSSLTYFLIIFMLATNSLQCFEFYFASLKKDRKLQAAEMDQKDAYIKYIITNMCGNTNYLRFEDYVLRKAHAILLVHNDDDADTEFLREKKQKIDRLPDKRKRIVVHCTNEEKDAKNKINDNPHFEFEHHHDEEEEEDTYSMMNHCKIYIRSLPSLIGLSQLHWLLSDIQICCLCDKNKRMEFMQNVYMRRGPFRNLCLTEAVFRCSLSGIIKIYLLIENPQFINTVIITSILISIVSYSFNVLMYYIPHNRKQTTKTKHYFCFYIAVASDFFLRSVLLSYMLKVTVDDEYYIPSLLIIAFVIASSYFNTNIEAIYKTIFHETENQDEFAQFAGYTTTQLTKISCILNSGWKFIIHCDPEFVKRRIKRETNIKAHQITEDGLTKINKICTVSLQEVAIRFFCNILATFMITIIISETNDIEEYNMWSYWLMLLILCFMLMIPTTYIWLNNMDETNNYLHYIIHSAQKRDLLQKDDKAPNRFEIIKGPTFFEWISSIIVFWVIFIIGVVTVLRSTVYYYPEAKDSDTSYTEFSEERAYDHLYFLTQNITVRNSYSSRKAAADYIYDELLQIQNESTYSDLIHVGISGFNASNVPHFGRNKYMVNNVWYYINFRDDLESDHILLSAHFDTQPNTVGANDDTIGTAAIIELAQLFSHQDARSTKQFTYNIVFVLIDGEEGGLFPGSRSMLWADDRPFFMKQHNKTKLVYNIESTGVGKHYLYRSNSDWMVRQYAICTKQPYAHSIADEIVAFAGVALGTDASIYGHHAHTLDVASLRDHWVYHTPLDDLDEGYLDGTLQLLGDNVAECVKHFGKRTFIPTDDFIPTDVTVDKRNVNDSLPVYSPNSQKLSNNLLYFSILGSSMIVITIYDMFSISVQFSIICLFINVCILLSTASSGDFSSYSIRLCKFSSIIVSLLLLNFFLNIAVCVAVSILLTQLRPSYVANIACNPSQTGSCFDSHWRGVEALFVATLCGVVFIITYLFQFIIAKINENGFKWNEKEKEELENTLTALHSPAANKMPNKQYLLKRGFQFTRHEVTKIVCININIFFSLITFILILLSKNENLTLLLHIQYITLFWTIFITMGLLASQSLANSAFKTYARKDRKCCCNLVTITYLDWVLVLILFFSIGFSVFPAFLSYEMCFGFIPIVLGFENNVPIFLVGALAGLSLSTIFMPFSYLMQHCILNRIPIEIPQSDENEDSDNKCSKLKKGRLFDYVFIISLVVIIILFVVTIAVKGKTMVAVPYDIDDELLII